MIISQHQGAVASALLVLLLPLYGLPEVRVRVADKCGLHVCENYVANDVDDMYSQTCAALRLDATHW